MMPLPLNCVVWTLLHCNQCNNVHTTQYQCNNVHTTQFNGRGIILFYILYTVNGHFHGGKGPDTITQ